MYIHWRRALPGTGLALAASAALLAVPALGAAATPFRATMTGSVSQTVCGPGTLCLTGTDHGTATHLGRATLTKTATIHLTATPCDDGGVLTTYTETGTLTAANGDVLTLSGGGTACAANGHAIGSGTLAVTGGTGRFAGASGSLTETIDHNLITNAETVTLRGTLSRAHGGRRSER